MNERVNINGTLFRPSEARISVYDHGFLYGDSVYETLRTYSNRIFLKEKHLARIYRSAEGISLTIPYTKEELEEEIMKTLKAAGNENSMIRVVLTRGVGPIGIDPDLSEKPNLIIFAKEHPRYPREYTTEGVSISLVTVKRNPLESLPPRIKSGNFLNNIFAIQESKREGSHEGIMLNMRGNITEGTTSNIFIVKDGIIKTPPSHAGILPGITRAFVLELASEEGIETAEIDITPGELSEADECFLTSTTREIFPVSRCSGKPIGKKAPGDITRRLMTRFRQKVEAFIRGQGSGVGDQGSEIGD